VKVSAQRLPESQVLLEIEVDPEQMERSLDKAYRKLVQRVDVPGFRKGKTPRAMLERHVGRERLVREAVDILIPEAYSQALDKEEIDPIGQPSIELLRDEPLSFKATVPIRPTVELGDYQSLRVERDEVQPGEGEVDSAIEELRHRYAVHEPVERPVQTGDIVRAEVRVVIDGRDLHHDEDAEFRLKEGAMLLLPGFAEGLLGAEKGTPKDVTVTVPPGEGSLAGKTGTVTTVVKEVKQERLPELNDDFAREVGEGFSSLAALRERLANDIRERLEAQAEENYREKALTALVEAARTIEFPPVLADREIERLVRDQARSTGMEVDRYLQMIKKTPEQLREDLTPAATERVKRALALTQLAEDEKIIVEPAEVDEEIERLAASSGQQAEQVRRMFASPDARMAIERSILTRKTMDRLVAIAGSARGGPAAKPAAKPARKKAKSKKTVKEES